MPKYNLTKVAEYPALGGITQKEANKRFENPGKGWGLTSAGVFTVEKIEPHRSYGRWANSAVPYGSETKIVKRNVVMVKLQGKWTKLSKLKGWKYRNEQEVYGALIDAYEDLFRESTVGAMKNYLNLDTKGLLDKLGVSSLPESPAGFEIPSKWLLNDFGHKAIKYFRDKDHNGKRGKKEKRNAQFMHSSPNTEIWTGIGMAARMEVVGKSFVKHLAAGKIANFADNFNKALLAPSHGCIHIFPKDIDTMVAKGYIQKTSIVEVHKASVKSKAMLTVRRYRTLNFEVHYYPMDNKVIVYQTSRVNASRGAAVH